MSMCFLFPAFSLTNYLAGGKITSKSLVLSYNPLMGVTSHGCLYVNTHATGALAQSLCLSSYYWTILTKPLILDHPYEEMVYKFLSWRNC